MMIVRVVAPRDRKPTREAMHRARYFFGAIYGYGVEWSRTRPLLFESPDCISFQFDATLKANRPIDEYPFGLHVTSPIKLTWRTRLHTWHVFRSECLSARSKNLVDQRVANDKTVPDNAKYCRWIEQSLGCGLPFFKPAPEKGEFERAWKLTANVLRVSWPARLFIGVRCVRRRGRRGIYIIFLWTQRWRYIAYFLLEREINILLRFDSLRWRRRRNRTHSHRE